MARLALLGRWLVEKHLLVFDHANLFVACLTADVLVLTLQGKRSPLVVIEQRRLPLRAVVTFDTRGHAILDELLAVNFRVAILTLGGSGSEIGSDELSLQVGWLVTIDAGGGLVRSEQWERRLRMVEARKLFPRLSRVASVAAGGSSIGADLLHAFVKLPLVRILMARGTGEIFPVIEDSWLGRSIRVRLLFMAIATGHGHVPAGQDKVRLFVPG